MLAGVCRMLRSVRDQAASAGRTPAWGRRSSAARCLLGALLLTAVGCSTVDLRSLAAERAVRPPKGGASVEELRAQALQSMDPAGRYRPGRSMTVRGQDVWESTLIRWLTPLDANVQAFEARLGLFHQGVAFTFQNGASAGRTIGFDGRSYAQRGGQKVYGDSASIALYLEPLQGYLEWPQTLLRSPTLSVLGTTERGGREYWLLYTVLGPSEDLEKAEQYILHMNAVSGRVEAIEFTMRDLLASYRGVLHYRDFRPVQGIVMPFWIGIGDALDDPDFDHVLRIESIRFYGLE